jgi:hypothetical protein
MLLLAGRHVDLDRLSGFASGFQVLQILSIAAKNGAILAGEKEPWCGLRNGLL